MIDLSEEPARLSIRGALLVIDRSNDSQEITIPLIEIAVLVVSHPCVSLSHAVLASLAKAGATFVACDNKHMPVAMVLPLEGHFIQAERFVQQAAASLPTRKRLWQQIVRAKVQAQGRVLASLHGGDQGLLTMADRVRSGDGGNIEAQASKRYWPALFGDPTFRRDRTQEDQNRLLNYGYMVLRAIVARAVCAAGLHPSLGLHHHNRYNAFCLADDLMEPFRPIVDDAVVSLVENGGPQTPLDKRTKAVLINALTRRFAIQDESRTLFDIVSRTTTSLAAVYAGMRKSLMLPEI